MRCPRCKHVNPPDTLFCEECDQRMDQPVRFERKGATIPPLYATVVALISGAASAALAVSLVLDLAAVGWFMPVALGAFGIVLSSYAMRVSRTGAGMDMNILILSGAALALAVMGFVLGIAMYG